MSRFSDSINRSITTRSAGFAGQIPKLHSRKKHADTPFVSDDQLPFLLETRFNVYVMTALLLTRNQCGNNFFRFRFRNNTGSAQVPPLFFRQPIRQVAGAAVPVFRFTACGQPKPFFDPFMRFLFRHNVLSCKKSPLFYNQAGKLKGGLPVKNTSLKPSAAVRDIDKRFCPFHNQSIITSKPQ
jgi:hypothetical protein